MEQGVLDHRGAAETPDSDWRRRFEVALGMPFTEGNSIDVLRNGAEIFPALLGAIRASERSIDMLWYYWGAGSITEQLTAALCDRARAGVRVRVLLDSFGGRDISAEHIRALRDVGCEVLFFRPLHSWRVTVLNLRTHRRLLICDERVGFTGGMGIDEPWRGHGDQPGEWRDTGFRVQGPAVDGMRSAFALSWLQTGRTVFDGRDVFPVQPDAGSCAVQVIRPASQPGWNEAALAFVTLLQSARERVRMTTPYSRLSGHLLAHVRAATQRGVHVQMLLPGPHVDRRLVHYQAQHDYQPLLDAGVDIWRYQPSLIHAKVYTVDRRIALVGTTNFDVRSVSLNEQIGLLVDAPDVVATLDRHFDDDLGHSHRLTAEEWQSRGLGHRVLETAANVAGYPLRGGGNAGIIGDKP